LSPRDRLDAIACALDSIVGPLQHRLCLRVVICGSVPHGFDGMHAGMRRQRLAKQGIKPRFPWTVRSEKISGVWNTAADAHLRNLDTVCAPARIVVET